MTLPLHVDFVGLSASAVSESLGYPKRKARPRPPASPTALAAKAAARAIRAIDRVEDTLPWRDADIVRGLLAAEALAQAYADLLFQRRVDELGTLPGGLRLAQQPGYRDYYDVQDSEGEPRFEVERDTPAATIRQMAGIYVSGICRGEADVYRRKAG